MKETTENIYQNPTHFFQTIHHIPQVIIPRGTESVVNYMFNDDKILQRFLPPENKFTLEWLDVSPAQCTAQSAAEKVTILIVCAGEGILNSDQRVIAHTGDVMAVPPNCEYSLMNSSEDLLRVLRISFEQQIEDLVDYTPPEQRLSLHDIQEYNNQRIKKHIETPLFKMLGDGTLEDPNKRKIFLSCLYVWSVYFQKVMFSRQATCGEKRYLDVFFQHLREELGHDSLLIKQQNIYDIRDPILKATGSWFVYKMFSLDNVGKTAVVHLVLEASGDEFHYRAQRCLKTYVHSDYFELHSMLDEGHAALGVQLLRHQHYTTYIQIRGLIEGAWNMLEAMMDRIVYLVHHYEPEETTASVDDYYAS